MQVEGGVRVRRDLRQDDICWYWIFIVSAIITGVLAIGLLSVYIPEYESVLEDHCLVKSKSYQNESGYCSPYITTFNVKPDSLEFDYKVCSPVDQCSSSVPKGPSSCYDISPSDLIFYESVNINSSYQCWVYHSNVFWNDPRSYSWNKIAAGIAMAVLTFVFMWINRMIQRRAFDPCVNPK